MVGKAALVPCSYILHMSSCICGKPSTVNDVPCGQCIYTVCRDSNQIKHLGRTIQTHYPTFWIVLNYIHLFNHFWKVKNNRSFITPFLLSVLKGPLTKTCLQWRKPGSNNKLERKRSQPLMYFNCFHKKGNIFVRQYFSESACEETYMSLVWFDNGCRRHPPCLCFSVTIVITLVPILSICSDYINNIMRM